MILNKLKHLILDIINKKIIVKRKYKYDNSFCLDHIFYVLKYDIPWNALNTYSCHYTTISKRFYLWSKIGIFKEAYYTFLSKYIYGKLINNIKWFQNLIIDSSMIKNMNGTECLGSNHYDRGRKAVKLSIICDQNKVPLSVSFYKANIHDVNTINNSIKNLPNKIFNDKRRNTNIIADKGYIINKETQKKLYNENKIKIITPKRKNSKNNTTLKEKKLLKDRYKIEHVFKSLDNYRRILYIRDKKIINHESFTFLALLIINDRYI